MGWDDGSGEAGAVAFAAVTKLQMIGGGKMGQALVGGLLAAGWAKPEELAIIEVLADLRSDLATTFPGVSVVEAPMADVDAVLAVKPHLVTDICAALEQPRRVLVDRGRCHDRSDGGATRIRRTSHPGDAEHAGSGWSGSRRGGRRAASLPMTTSIGRSASWGLSARPSRLPRIYSMR